MTATEILRRLLDERGVEWGNIRNDGSESDYLTEWQFEDNQGKAIAIEWAVGSGLSVEIHRYHLTPEQAIAATLGPKVTGNTSDGYHTFNELYHHRAVLFSVIVRDHRELAWKSMRHHDGTMYDGMFIVGIETPEGQATYHYDIDPYWDIFNCKELDQAPEWDGHTPSEAIERIATLGSCNCPNNCTNGERTEACHDMYTDDDEWFACSECNTELRVHEPFGVIGSIRFCPNCGAKVIEPTTNDVDAEVEQ